MSEEQPVVRLVNVLLVGCAQTRAWNSIEPLKRTRIRFRTMAAL